MRTRSLSLLALLLVPSATSCVSDKVTGESKFSFVDWTVEEELAMGREASPLVEAQYDSVLVDREATEYLGAVVEEMASRSVRADDFDFEFSVLNSSLPNAFALPGGQVYITRGLLAQMESEGQFVSVMGHELGHVEHQHAMFKQSRGLLASLPGRTVASIGRNIPIVGGITGTAGGLINLGPALYVLSYDRGQEIQSDERGVYFSAEMGYDPREGLKTFELFERLEKESGGGGQLTILSTHPANVTRIEKMREAISAEYPEVEARPASSFRSGGARFEELVSALRARQPAYDHHARAYALLSSEDADEETVAGALAELRKALELVPDEPLFHLALGELLLLTGEAEEALQHLQTSAETYARFSPTKGHWKPFFYLGFLAFAAEADDAALQALEAAEARCPAVPELQLVLGLVEERSGSKARAKEHYEKVLELAPKGSEIYEEARARARAL
jgi:predicted Zn-dependent protease